MLLAYLVVALIGHVVPDTDAGIEALQTSLVAGLFKSDSISRKIQDITSKLCSQSEFHELVKVCL